MNTSTAATIKTRTARVIWKCNCSTKAVEYTATRRAYGADRFGNVRWTDAVLTRVLDGATIDISHDSRCGACGAQRKSVVVRGRVTDHKCDARCTNSKSGVCECSCGGANHGRGWM